MNTDVSDDDVVIVCGESLPHGKLSSSSFWAANRLALVRCCEEPASVLTLCSKLRPSLVVARQGLLDRLSDNDLANITGGGKTARILVILNQERAEDAEAMVRRGCHGILPPRFPASVLRRAVPAILAGEIWAPRRVISEMLSELLNTRTGSQENNLTPREEHIRELVARGYKNSEIAAALFISQETVRWHKRRLHRKMGKAGQAGAAVQAHRMPPASEGVSLEASSREAH